MSAYIIHKMTEYGYVFRDDSVGNLLFYRSVSGEKTMLATHMDTVALANEPWQMSHMYWKTRSTSTLMAVQPLVLMIKPL